MPLYCIAQPGLPAWPAQVRLGLVRIRLGPGEVNGPYLGPLGTARIAGMASMACAGHTEYSGIAYQQRALLGLRKWDPCACPASVLPRLRAWPAQAPPCTILQGGIGGMASIE